MARATAVGGDEDNSGNSNCGGHRQKSTKRASSKNVGGNDGDSS